MDDFKDILEDKDIKYYFQKYKKYIIVGIITIIIIVSIVFLLIYSTEKQDHTIKKNNNILVTEKQEKEKTKIKKPKMFKVDIKGEIVNPTVYELEENNRIIDVITKAGGLTEEADTSYLNLSKKISDEMVIIIYSKEEVKKYKEKNEGPKYIYIENDCECPDDMNDACINEKTDKKTTTDKTDESEENTEIISINKATSTELQTLPGIGKSKADNIVSYRKENGNFKNIEDIKNVTGIGDSIFEQIKDKITV